MKFVAPPKLKLGDKVAIVAPSSGAAALFPWVYQQGLQRMRDIFGLVPVEFPTTKNISNSPRFSIWILATPIHKFLFPAEEWQKLMEQIKKSSSASFPAVS